MDVDDVLEWVLEVVALGCCKRRALIGKARVGVAIGDHEVAALEGRFDHPRE